MRQLDIIEEGFLKELLKTGKCCPLSQLYAEYGLLPGRYEIIRIILLYFLNILTQKEDRMILSMVNFQLRQPKRGDWPSAYFENLKELELVFSLEEIKSMKKSKIS